MGWCALCGVCVCVHFAVGWYGHLVGDKGPFSPGLNTYTVLGCGYDQSLKGYPTHLQWGPMPKDEIPDLVEGILDGLDQLMLTSVGSRGCGVEALLCSSVLVWDMTVCVIWCWRCCMTLHWCQAPCVL